MERKIKILIGVIVILSLLVLGLGGYILYDKVLKIDNNLNNDTNVEENNDNKVNEENSTTQVLEESVKKKFLFVYNFFDTPNTYCGDTNDNDRNTTSKVPSNGFIASTEFTSYDEMIDYLKKYITEELIFRKAQEKNERYVEQEGKLYCEDLGKGGNIYQIKDVEIEIKMVNSSQTIAQVTAIMELFNDESVRYEEKYDLIIDDSNGGIVTLYNKVS